MNRNWIKSLILTELSKNFWFIQTVVLKFPLPECYFLFLAYVIWKIYVTFFQNRSQIIKRCVLSEEGFIFPKLVWL